MTNNTTATLLLMMMMTVAATTTTAFVGPAVSHWGITRTSSSTTTTTTTTTTTLFIDKRIADMIDQEYYREQHLKEFERDWMKENKKVLTYHMHEEEDMMRSKYLGDEEENFRSRAKDRIMAQQNPQMYCADRCLSTGNCDIFEEWFHFSPYEVMEFCRECVLSEDELCDVPDAFYNNNNKNKKFNGNKLKP